MRFEKEPKQSLNKLSYDGKTTHNSADEWSNFGVNVCSKLEAKGCRMFRIVEFQSKFSFYMIHILLAISYHVENFARVFSAATGILSDILTLSDSSWLTMRVIVSCQKDV